ncbi:hypothetical protein ACFYMH_28420 [Streptomyces albidoflavus]
MDLRTTVTLLPTPAARDWKSGESNLIGTNARPLNEVAVNLLPTPVAADGDRRSHTYARGNPTLQGAASSLTAPPAGAPSRSMTAEDSAPDAPAAPIRNSDGPVPLLPTPRASDGEKGGPNQRGSKGDLALPAVAHRIGAGSAPPSPAGSTPPDDEPHGQLTIAIA